MATCGRCNEPTGYDHRSRTRRWKCAYCARLCCWYCYGGHFPSACRDCQYELENPWIKNPCPLCGAKEGELCTTSGAVRQRPHARRKTA